MNKKIIVFSLAMVLLLGVTMGATFALLVDTDNVVTNTFTFGNVTISLDESPVDLYGNVVAGERRTANDYKLVPEGVYTKDPQVHVGADSELSWLFVKVENPISALEESGKTIEDQMTANGWTELAGETGVWVYNKKIIGTTLGADYDKTDDDVLANIDFAADIKVFETLNISADANVASAKDKQIIVTAYAVQAEGVDTVEAAWNAVKPA